MALFFLIVGVIMGWMFLSTGAGVNVGYGLVCGLAFVAAAIARLAQAVERLSAARQTTPTNRHAWSMPDPVPPVEQGGTTGPSP